MGSIAVTGALSAVGSRVVRLLAADPDIHRVVALDTSEMAGLPAKAESHVVDLANDDLSSLIDGCSAIVHLAQIQADDHSQQLLLSEARALFDQAEAVGCHHVVLLSSATVYGAYADNPVPITESLLPRPIQSLSFAVNKRAVELELESWVARSIQRSSCIMRPSTSLSERGAGWVALAIRSATATRPSQIDPPLQFLHHDDLASALSLAARRPLTGLYNVAPDGWIGSQAFNELAAAPPLRIPAVVTKGWKRLRSSYGLAPIPEGIEPYVSHPWVIANDRLRKAGWVPAFSNEEAYVLGTPAPPWDMSPKRRQEVALGVAGVAVASAAAAVAAAGRRASR